MKPILQLENEIEVLEKSKRGILELWIQSDEVMEVLQRHQIQAAYFMENFAAEIFDYYLAVVKKEKEIGDCPVMSVFLDFLKEQDISAAELFLICTNFRKAMIDVLFDLGRMNKALFDEVSYVFDLNFSGVLDQYSGRIYKAQHEAKLHKRRFEEYNLAIDQSAMVCKTDNKGVITYINSKFSELSGYSTEELIGSTVPKADADAKDDRTSLTEEMWAEVNNVYHSIVEDRTKQGKDYYTETTIVPMLDTEGRVEENLIIKYDVSELIRTRDAALEAERTKDQFLANMSHEIRTPLNAILGFVAVLRKRVKDSENSRYLDVIHSSGQNLLSIIADILDFAKIKEGKLQIDKHMFNPIQELSNTLELFSSKMFEKNIEYLTYIDPNLPFKIKLDAVRLKQILTNFLSNALKFTPENGQVIVTIRIKNDKFIISVKDSGCGIEEGALDRIFSAFEQAEGSTTRKYGGTGLGLSICHRLSELMGGRIEVESRVSEGSLFRLLLPIEASKERNLYENYTVYLHEEKHQTMQLLRRYMGEMKMKISEEASLEAVNFYYHDSTVSKQKPYVLVASAPVDDKACLIPAFDPYKIMKKIEGEKVQKASKGRQKPRYIGHILVAEDNNANQMLMKLILEEYGLSYVIANNGQEAFEIFTQEKFNLVLMDEQMPIMNGLESAEKIMEYEDEHKLKHTPIISVTANALKGDRERFLEAGMDGYVAKPIESQKLEIILNKFMHIEGENMSQNMELPSYGNLSAEEMAGKIGLNVKHIPILLQSFTDESKSLLEQLEVAIKDKNYDEIGNLAHSIKGSSGNLKFDEMYELAKTLEHSAKEANDDYPYAEAYASLKKGIESISL